MHVLVFYYCKHVDTNLNLNLGISAMQWSEDNHIIHW